MRGTPLMLQLMFIFFAPYYIFGVQLSMDWKFGACAVAFIMNYSAYFAEILPQWHRVHSTWRV